MGQVNLCVETINISCGGGYYIANIQGIFQVRGTEIITSIPCKV